MAPRSLSHNSSGGQNAPHAHGFDVQRDVQVFGGRGEEILREHLLRVGVEIPADGGADIGQLAGRKAGAAAKHHVFLCVGHAGKARRRLIRADLVIDHRGHHRRQRIAHNDHAQPVVQGRPEDIFVRRRAAAPQAQAIANARRRTAATGTFAQSDFEFMP